METLIAYSTRGIEAAGVLVILGGLLRSAWHYVRYRQTSPESSYKRFRRQIGRSILLGLELLVAPDIIATVAIEPTRESVLVLAEIVLIRTFLSFSLEVELEGRLPSRGKEEVRRRRRLRAPPMFRNRAPRAPGPRRPNPGC
jgi:uncharacterized membrane protein